MNFSEAQLPSNKKFGIFFTLIFTSISFYFFFKNLIELGSISFVIAALFAIVTITKDKLLFPLNKLWMRFGILLSIIVSPIIMGIIFFGLFTPMSLIMRLFRRDELRIRFNNKKTHWIKRNFPNGDDLAESFKHQY